MLVVVAFAPFFMGSARGFAGEIQDCLGEAVSVTGKPSRIGELARGNAFFTWKEVVKEKHGADYMAWVDATERQLNCRELVEGADKGKWQCVRIGRPCRKPANLRVLEVKCRETVSSAWGAARKQEADAKAQAIRGWELRVKREIGADWAIWDAAKTKSIGCQKRNYGRVQCLAEGYACSGPVADGR